MRIHLLNGHLRGPQPCSGAVTSPLTVCLEMPNVATQSTSRSPISDASVPALLYAYITRDLDSRAAHSFVEISP